jgi:hypothetical protein
MARKERIQIESIRQVIVHQMKILIGEEEVI